MHKLFSALAALSVFSAVRAEIVINEIHYNPDVKTEPAEFIELYNPGPDAADLTGWRFSSGIHYSFPAGTTIVPGAYLVVAQDPVFLKKKFNAAALGPWTGSLARDGEKVTLTDSEGVTRDEVDYQLGFPWPTVGAAPGYSIELLNPLIDNDLGGSWRASVGTSPGGAPGASLLIPAQSTWRFFKGVTAPSNPAEEWRAPNFDDSAWLDGKMPAGYGEAFIATTLADMRNNYSSVFFRRTFVVADPAAISNLILEAQYDDGFKVWITGSPVLDRNMPAGEVPFNGFASTVREDLTFELNRIPAPIALVAGTNVIAVQAHNSSLAASSDFFFDLRLTTEARDSARGPTPGRRNSVYSESIPPQIRQVSHHPDKPRSGEAVLVQAKVTALSGVGEVSLKYQVVDPGNYIALGDPAYATDWTTVAMRDDGTEGDAIAGDHIYTATLPADVQRHRRLVRYRIAARDAAGALVEVPYPDDPQPNFAYFVYDGVPAWRGASRPGVTPVVEFGTNVMNSLPVYHLLSKKNDVEASTWRQKYSGSEYLWSGTLVYDGEVYDHIHYRTRGGVWRYAMGKNMWKFAFNRGHEFQARDNYGEKYAVKWKKLNLGACIQQGDFNHRGEQGMFESVGFRLFNFAGTEAPLTHFLQFRVIDQASEQNPTNQYNGDLWGLYLAVEQEDGRFLDEHDLPDGNLYKMEGGSGSLNNTGPLGPLDKSDLNAFLGTYSGAAPNDAWWRTNLDLPRYYGYRAILEGIHHYDIGDGKNYFYYLNPDIKQWSVHPWDIDLTWADNMYGDGNEPFKSRVLTSAHPQLLLDFRNRVREIRDLLFNTDQTYQLIDEYAALIRDPVGGPSVVDMDRAMWDYNPVMVNSSLVNLGKAGQGRFYQISPTKDFPGMLTLMKNYVRTRSAILDNLSRDAAIPGQPSITYLGPGSFAANRLRFHATDFAGAAGFAALDWRVAEITDPGEPGFNPRSSRKYEIQPIWEKRGTNISETEIVLPPGRLQSGRTYRVRARYQDSTGRASNWSAPIQFKAGDSDNAQIVAEHLLISELMFHPKAGNEYEYVELHNDSLTDSVDLAGLTFTAGISFTFPGGAVLGPGEYLLLTHATNANNFADFRRQYGLGPEVKIAGPYSGNLKDEGETLRLENTASNGVVFDFTYGGSAGWPIPADGAGHSLVPAMGSGSAQASGGLSYSGNWVASHNLGGSPGGPEPLPTAGLRINEIGLDRTNSWVELYNEGSTRIDTAGWFLSDDPTVLDKWSLPSAGIEPHAWISFDQQGWTLSQGGASSSSNGAGWSVDGGLLFLSQLTGNGPGRIADSVRFKAQSGSRSWGRYPDGADFFEPLAPTRQAANREASPRVMIQEIMYHPGPATDAAADPGALEYIELFNPGPNAVELFGLVGSWRLDGAARLVFPPGQTLGAGEYLLLVNFNPAETQLVDAFKKTYRAETQNLRLIGPYSGTLPNSSGRIALEKPVMAIGATGGVAWEIEDEVIYADQAPWSAEADGTGASLHRAPGLGAGSDPKKWFAGTPSPGRSTPDDSQMDSDGDGMPDWWERSYALNPADPADARLDSDEDGQSNLQEFLAGTNPRNDRSSFRLAIIPAADPAAIRIRFTAAAGRAYFIQSRSSLAVGAWTTVREVLPDGSGSFEFYPNPPIDTAQAFYRVIPEVK